MGRIVILGAGVMGSAMCLPAAAAGHGIDLVGTHLDEEIVRSVQGNGFHPRLGVTLPAATTAHHWPAFRGLVGPDVDLVILGVSSAGVGWAIDRLCEALDRPVPVLMITKGLAPTGEGIDVLPHVVRSALKERLGMDVPVMAVGGPCIAGELAAGRHTGVVVTGDDPGLVERTIGMLVAEFYHARPSTDVVGVEVCAAFKNFYAIGVGWATGRLEREGKAGNGAGMFNLSASLFTQALRELGLLTRVLGGDQGSVGGLPGAGDLYVTCLAGRNSRMGRLLGLGLPYSEAKAEHMAADTVEGAELALAVGPTLRRMWQDGRLERAAMPLTAAIVAAICDDAVLDPDWTAFHR
jgi:glycerol-3-phosphate dehydrogenase (NAD(P)+)